MKILIATHSLDGYTGSETFSYTLAVALQGLGEKVTCFSPIIGPLAKKLREAGVCVVDDLSAVSDEIDVIHAQHRHETMLAYARFPNKPMIVVCHGVLPDEEQPFTPALNIFSYVAVSEEVKEHLALKHHIDPNRIAIIRNGIDFRRFYCRKPINPKPKRILVLSNYMGEAQLSVIRELAEIYKLDLDKIGFPDRAVWNVEDYINDADIVIGLGRGALEAMACKRIVLVHDYNGGDGLITPHNLEALQRRNFSGRTNRIAFDVEGLASEIAAYNPDMVDAVFDLVRRDYDIDIVARQYLNLYRESIRNINAKDRDSPAQLVLGSGYLVARSVLRELQNAKNTVKERESLISIRDKQLRDVQQVLELRDKQLSEVRNSISWRYTAPFRVLRRLLINVGPKFKGK